MTKVYVQDGKHPQGNWIDLRANLAEQLEDLARDFYHEQYADTPYDTEMVKFAARFAAYQMTGYRAVTIDNSGYPSAPKVTEREG